MMDDAANRLLKADLIMRIGSYSSCSLTRFVVISIGNTAHRLLKPDQMMHDASDLSHVLPRLVVPLEHCWNSHTGY